MISNPRHIRISDYNYPLPDERIAKFPIAQRDHSARGRLVKMFSIIYPNICPRVHSWCLIIPK